MESPNCLFCGRPVKAVLLCTHFKDMPNERSFWYAKCDKKDCGDGPVRGDAQSALRAYKLETK